MAKAGQSERVRAETLELHPRNSRQGDVGAIAQSLEAHGQYRPIVAQSATRRVLAGNHTLLAARALGWDEIDVVWLDIDDEAALRILLVDNRTNDLAIYDDGALAELLTELANTPAGLIGTGYDGDALDELLADLKRQQGPAGVDEVTEPPENPVTKPGDLWELGDHRLLCGDAMKAADYAIVLDGKKAALCLTDPPYANDTEYGSYDDTTENLARLVERAIPEVLKRSTVALVTPGVGNLFRYPPPKWVLCWPVENGVYGAGSSCWGFACWQPILAYGPDPYLARGLGRRPDTIITPSLPPSSKEHPVAKPIEIWEWLMERGSAERGDVVLDCFAGSGTTIVAAENLGRFARLIEIDPGYCDVICTRYQNLTGTKPERDGQPYDFLT